MLTRLEDVNKIQAKTVNEQAELIAKLKAEHAEMLTLLKARVKSVDDYRQAVDEHRGIKSIYVDDEWVASIRNLIKKVDGQVMNKKTDITTISKHSRSDYIRRKSNIDGNYDLCQRCFGTGNELCSMYKKCQECNGTGIEHNCDQMGCSSVEHVYLVCPEKVEGK